MIYIILHGNTYVAGFSSKSKAVQFMNEKKKLCPATRYMLYEAKFLMEA